MEFVRRIYKQDAGLGRESGHGEGRLPSALGAPRMRRFAWCPKPNPARPAQQKFPPSSSDPARPAPEKLSQSSIEKSKLYNQINCHTPMIGENQQLVANEPVEFEKYRMKF